MFRKQIILIGFITISNSIFGNPGPNIYSPDCPDIESLYIFSKEEISTFKQYGIKRVEVIDNYSEAKKHPSKTVYILDTNGRVISEQYWHRSLFKNKMELSYDYLYNDSGEITLRKTNDKIYYYRDTIAYHPSGNLKFWQREEGRYYDSTAKVFSTDTVFSINLETLDSNEFDYHGKYLQLKFKNNKIVFRVLDGEVVDSIVSVSLGDNYKVINYKKTKKGVLNGTTEAEFKNGLIYSISDGPYSWNKLHFQYNESNNLISVTGPMYDGEFITYASYGLKQYEFKGGRGYYSVRYYQYFEK